jgi:hypothetical protein
MDDSSLLAYDIMKTGVKVHTVWRTLKGQTGKAIGVEALWE